MVMKKRSLVPVFVLGMLSTVLILVLFGFGDDVKSNKKNAANLEGSAPMRPPSLPDEMNFAGEKVPLDRWDIREQLDREILVNYFGQSNIYYMLKLQSRYFPEIEAALKANNMPDDFKYLCIAESNLQNLVSRVGASGFWQFMKVTAPGYGLEVSETVDERYHVAKSTAAACTYLKNAYQRFGNWTAAAASYNCGMGGYNSRATFQKTNYYYDLVLPEETQRYIFRILAFKHLLQNADSLGFALPAAERYQPVKTRTVSISSSISNLEAFARENGSNYKMLKLLNPWLRERSLRAKPGKTYQLLLPAS